MRGNKISTARKEDMYLPVLILSFEDECINMLMMISAIKGARRKRLMDPHVRGACLIEARRTLSI